MATCPTGNYPARICALEEALLSSGPTPGPPSVFGDPIGQFGVAMAEGTTTNIYVYGDSTLFGYLDGGGTASPSPVQTFQNALRSYYNNTAAVLTNKSVSGVGTSYALSIWPTEMPSIVPRSIVWISLGTNDATGLTPETKTAIQYQANLLQLVTDARAAGHTVVLESPLPLLNYGGFGTQVRSERLKQFADVMRAVAKDLSVPFVDTYEHFDRIFEGYFTPSTFVSDGIHLTQAGYDRRGYWMANLFMKAPILPVEGIVQSIEPAFRSYGGVGAIIPTAGSAVGYGRVAAEIRIPLEVREPGTDIYLATALWALGTSALTVKCNGATVYSANLQEAALPGSTFAVDHETMVLRNLYPGLYLIEMSAASLDAALYYVSAKPTRDRSSALGGGAPVPAELTLEAEGDLTMVTNAGSTGQSHFLSEVTASSAIKDLTVTLNAKFGDDQGFFIHGTRRFDASSPRGGVLIYLINTTGYLTVTTGTAAGYSTLVTLGAADLRSAEHEYSVTMSSTTGQVSVAVDGTVIGTYTPTIAYRGGRVGAYALGASKTVKLKNVRVG